MRSTLSPDAYFILENANKRNLKSILRYWFKRQEWNPFCEEPVEFARLNFDFHPTAIRRWLSQNQFEIRKQLTVSHFRAGLLKELIPTGILAGLDGLLQPTGSWFQLTPRVFLKAQAVGGTVKRRGDDFYKCLVCGAGIPEAEGDLRCTQCGHLWKNRQGIIDFRIGT